jgi:raffinose/stachyose/melibiose transport system permease protein
MLERRPATLYLMMLPALLIVCSIIVFPLLSTLYTSFFYWKGQGFSMRFVGLDNYRAIFADPRFLNAIKNNIIWLVLSLIIPVLCGFVLAMLLNTDVSGQNIFKAIFYFPGVISFVSTGIIFSLIYYNKSGLLNTVLRLLGLKALAMNWLASPWTALPAVVLASSWQYIGFCMVLFLAAVQQVPIELLEAADMDGARILRKVRSIIVPIIKPVTAVVIIITMINAMRVFDLIYIMTAGGPANMTEVIGLLMYQKSFTDLLWGIGASYGVIMLIMTSIPAILYVRMMLRGESTL